jgi:hypothetical protein
MLFLVGLAIVDSVRGMPQVPRSAASSRLSSMSTSGFPTSTGGYMPQITGVDDGEVEVISGVTYVPVEVVASTLAYSYDQGGYEYDVYSEVVVEEPVGSVVNSESTGKESTGSTGSTRNTGSGADDSGYISEGEISGDGDDDCDECDEECDCEEYEEDDDGGEVVVVVEDDGEDDKDCDCEEIDQVDEDCDDCDDSDN